MNKEVLFQILYDFNNKSEKKSQTTRNIKKENLVETEGSLN